MLPSSVDKNHYILNSHIWYIMNSFFSWFVTTLQKQVSISRWWVKWDRFHRPTSSPIWRPKWSRTCQCWTATAWAVFRPSRPAAMAMPVAAAADRAVRAATIRQWACSIRLVRRQRRREAAAAHRRDRRTRPIIRWAVRSICARYVAIGRAANTMAFTGRQNRAIIQKSSIH